MADDLKNKHHTNNLIRTDYRTYKDRSPFRNFLHDNGRYIAGSAALIAVEGLLMWYALHQWVDYIIKK
jgi:hypothetical protein